MSLKSLIQRLLDSRTTPSEAANNAMPSESSTAVQMLQTSTVDWANVANYTAPTDGFISARGMSTSANAYFQIMAGSTVTNPSTSLQVSTASQWPQMVLPVAKGRKIAVYAAMMKDITVFFNSAIGGGYNLFLWRAQPCLRALSNFLLKVSSRAKDLGLVFRDFRQLRRQSYPRQWTQHGDRMSLLRTGTWFFMAERLNSSCITRLVQALIMGASHVSLEDLYRFGRAALCTITSKVRTAPQYSPLLHVSLSNFEKGGSLC